MEYIYDLLYYYHYYYYYWLYKYHSDSFGDAVSSNAFMQRNIRV